MIAVFRIDEREGRELAKMYRSRGGELGKISLDILTDKEYLYDRTTYFEALRNYIGVTHAL